MSYLSYRLLRPCIDIEILKLYGSNKETFVALPTGYGKFIIFAILSVYLNNVKVEFVASRQNPHASYVTATLTLH